jgi:hypothetical protein
MKMQHILLIFLLAFSDACGGMQPAMLWRRVGELYLA